MWRLLKTRAGLKRSYTMAYPAVVPALPPRFVGRPAIADGACPTDCRLCERTCPQAAVHLADGPELDMGRCLFCGDCGAACPQGRLSFSGGHAMAASSRTDLERRAGSPDRAEILCELARRHFRRSFKLRQVSAGGCGACEADANVLGTPAWDFGRFGIQFVASPRHADALLVTGPVSRNMRLALEKTYAAVPAPRLVIASGACAISGGPYAGHSEVCDGVDSLLPVDLYVPGCPPHPLTLLDGLLRLIGIEVPA